MGSDPPDSVVAGHPLLRQSAGAVAWGLFFGVAPYDGTLLLSAVLWIPLLIWAERRRTRRYGFLPGALLRAAVIGTVLLAVHRAPLAYEERRVGPLGPDSATLRAVDSLHAARTGRTHPRLFAALDDSITANTVVALPAEPVARYELLRLIGGQIGREPRIAYEGGSTSVAFGPQPLFIAWPEGAER